MKFQTLPQLTKVANSGSYKHCALFKSTGEQLIGWNSQSKTLKDKFREISTRLSSENLPEGIYCLYFKSTLAKNIVPDIYYFSKGEPEPGQQIVVAPPGVKQPTLNDNSPERVLTYQGALALNTELEKLKYENSKLKERVSEMEEGDEMEEEEEEGSGMSEQTTQLLQTLVPSVVGIAEQFFALRTRELDLKEKELNSKLPGLPGAKVSGGHENPEEKKTYDIKNPVELMQYLRELSETNPEEYQKYIQTLNTQQ